jgi:hypothetical protein
MLTATAQATNPDPILIWQISLLEDLTANYSMHQKFSGTMIQMMHILSVASLSAQTSPIMGSPQKSFTARYHRKEKASINKLEEYFNLPTEYFDACDLVQWWMGQRAQFLNLFCLLMISYAFLVGRSYTFIFFLHKTSSCQCKGTSVHLLTSSLLSYSPPVHMYPLHTSVPSPGTTPQS